MVHLLSNLISLITYYGTNDLVNCSRSFDRILHFQLISHAIQINVIVKLVVT